MKNSEFWQSTKGKALIKLILWGIFFLIILIICGISSNTYEEEKEEVIKESITYKDKLLELINSNYDYKYNVNINDSNYIFTGKMNNNINTGYIESNDGIIKYIIENDNIYQDVMNEKIVNEELFNKYNIDYLNFNFINDLLVSFPLEEDNYCLYTIDGITYNVYYDNEHINKIIIENEEFEYNMEFNNIEELK